MTRVRSGSATDVGRARSINQDTPLVAEGLYAVCDGMGGHRGGEVASQVAVESLREHFVDTTLAALVAAVQAANESVYERALGDPDLRGMGTTLCAVALVDVSDSPTNGASGRGAPAAAEAGLVDGERQLGVVNVGDSRVYLFRDGDLVQLTRDHSLVEEMVRDGRLSPDEALSHPQRNVLTRALGVEPSVQVDAEMVIPYTGDRYLLCSDGLFNEVDEARIAATLRRLADPNEVARELVRLANEAGGRDNITVVVVDIVDDDGRAGRASAALAGDPSSTTSHTDLAGFSTALVDDDASGADAEAKGRRKEKREARDRPARARRLTWRVAVFVLVLFAVFGAATVALGTYARRTYYVGFDGERVAIFKGRPGGFLWFDPTLEEPTTIARTEVPASRVLQIEDGRQESSLAAAREYIASLEEQISRFGGRGSTTSTSTTSSTTSTSTSTSTVSTSSIG